jgi:hypothetical protein
VISPRAECIHAVHAPRAPVHVPQSPTMFASWTSARRQKLMQALKSHLEHDSSTELPGKDHKFWRKAALATAPPPMGSTERTAMHLAPDERYVEPDELCEAVHDAAKGLPSHKVLEAIEKLHTVSKKRGASSSSEAPAKRIASSVPADMRRSQSATGLVGLARLVEAR